SVTLLTVIPWPGDGGAAAPPSGGGGGAAAPPRATAGAAMAWAPGVGLLLGVIASAVLLLADHPLGAGPLTASGLAVGSPAVVTGRLALTWACRRGVPAARPDGLGALVAGSVRPAVPAAVTAVTLAAAAAAVAISATVAGGLLGWTLPLAVAAGLAAAFAVQRHAVRRLGGITGDVLGALAESAATVTLVVAAMGPPA